MTIARLPAFFILVIALLACRAAGADSVRLNWDRASAPLAFAYGEIEAALGLSGYEITPTETADRTITIKVATNTTELARGFVIQSGPDHCLVNAANAIEAMYGGLELAEQLRQGHDIFAVREMRREPFIAKRGIKFNIPLDARTPSYDDSGDAAQKNIAEMWNMAFWTAFLDQMARDRYNMLSLWNPHPFPSMIRSEVYPEVALDDVCVTTLVPNGRENEWGEPQLVSANVLENLKVLKQVTIEEKIAFWRSVLGHATDRGIAVYFITWNICPNSVAQPVQPYYRTYDNDVAVEPPGKYGVTHQINNPETVRYLRDAVKTFLLTYPEVKGIGVTSGEHMPISSDLDREQWMWDTYAEGILDAKREQPGRSVDFIHRVWNTDLATIMATWKDYPDTFELGFKYAKARLYSSPDIPFAEKLIEAMKPHGLKAWWNLRNDDIYVHRWGDPDYVRTFLQNFTPDATAGYHMGSDGYVWGREFVSRMPKSLRELEIEKHWYAFMLWGRLGYDPTLDRDYFVSRIAEKYPGTESQKIYEIWQTASKIIPLVNRFCWRDWDHMWSVENSNSHVEGFHGVERFCDNRTMAGSDLVNIRDFVRARVAGKSLDGTTPSKVADALDELAAASLHGADAMPAPSNVGLRSMLDDIRGMAWLGRYYADKIRAAVALATFQSTGDKSDRDEALRYIQAAYEDCTRYVDHSQELYHSQMLARTGLFDWSAMLNNARKDVAVVRATRPRP